MIGTVHSNMRMPYIVVSRCLRHVVASWCRSISKRRNRCLHDCRPSKQSVRKKCNARQKPLDLDEGVRRRRDRARSGRLRRRKLVKMCLDIAHVMKLEELTLDRRYPDAVHGDILKRRTWKHLDALDGDIWMPYTARFLLHPGECCPQY